MSNKLPIRIAAGCWCLACVVLINSYSSVLISFLTISNPNLLINSIEELKDRPNVYLVTDKGLSTDVLLTVDCLQVIDGSVLRKRFSQAKLVF